MALWLSAVGFLYFLYLMLAIRLRPSVALGIVMPLSWLFPAWTTLDVGIELLNIKAAVGIAMLVSYSFLPKATFPWRFVPADFALLGLVLVSLVSDFWHEGMQWTIPAVSYVEWILPYLAGRLAIQKREDLNWIWPVLAIVGLLLGIAAFLEAWLRMNPYEWIFGLRPLEGANREVVRWNIRRAYGPCFHPLYFGVLLCWLFAWSVHAGWRALLRRSNPIWLIPPFLGLIAPLATGSRGPFIGTLLVLACLVFCALRTWRWPLTMAAGFLLVVFMFYQNQIFVLLDDWSGEFQRGRQASTVTFDEQAEKVSSARSRLTLFRIYWSPLTRAGLLGYGTGAVTGFPVNVPIGSEEAEAAKQIWALDNTYILITLRFGYLGLFFFLSLLGWSLWQLLKVHDLDPRRSTAAFSAALFGATAAVAWLIFGVWTPSDFGFPWLWGIGLSSGLYLSLSPQMPRSAAEPQ